VTCDYVHGEMVLETVTNFRCGW